jgi:uncharacterized membrane protein YedE/YeeE
VAMLGLFGLNALGVCPLPKAPATVIAGNLIGGLIFGFGMAAVGY